jgi:hypothetical protein
VETDVERLLARARAAAAAGDHHRALVDVHAALLRTLEQAGLVEVHPFRTNGEYLGAATRARPALGGSLRAFLGDVEEVQFGGAPAGEALFQSLVARVRALGSALPPAAVALAVALGAAGASGCRPLRGGWDHSPSGRAGVIDLLERAGKPAHERLSPVATIEPDTVDGLVLLPGAQLTDGDWSKLDDWVRYEGGLLVLAGVPARAPRWIGIKPAAPSQVVIAHVHEAPRAAAELGALDLPLPPSLPLASAPDYHALLLRTPDLPYAAERTRGEGRLLALGDDRLFTNAALPFGDNARALILLLRKARRIELVGELTGLVSPNPVASVTRGRLAPFLAQLAVVIVLFFLLRGVPLGRLRDPPPPARRSFVEHVDALGEQYARARGARHLLAAYGPYATERLRERVRLSPRRGLIDLADAVAARTGRPVAAVMAVLMEARDAAAPGQPATPAPHQETALAVARQLGELLEELAGRERSERTRFLEK